MVLRGVVPIRDEPDAEVLAGLEFARLVNVVTDLFDVLRGGGDVAPLRSSAVLDEDEISKGPRSVSDCCCRRCAAEAASRRRSGEVNAQG